MAKFKCEACVSGNPCFFDTGEGYSESVIPDSCPCNDEYTLPEWEVIEE